MRTAPARSRHGNHGDFATVRADEVHRIAGHVTIPALQPAPCDIWTPRPSHSFAATRLCTTAALGIAIGLTARARLPGHCMRKAGSGASPLQPVFAAPCLSQHQEWLARGVMATPARQKFLIR